MQLRLANLAVVLAIAPLVTSCHDATGLEASRRAAAGFYVLATVNGDDVPTSDPSAPTSGEIYLWPGGHAERHISYSTSGGSQEIVMTGTFFVERDTVTLELHTVPGDSYTWIVQAPLNPGGLTLGYPGPADGWMLEEYRRR